MMRDNNDLDQNERVLIDAFKLQNEQAYDESLEKLQAAGQNLIRIIEKIESSPQFYMRHMQLMKEERDLVCEKDYKEFLAKNDKILSRNYEKNAYLALLMKEIEERESEAQSKKWTHKEEELMRKIIKDGQLPLEDIEQKFQRHRKDEVQKKYEQLRAQRTENEENQMNE